MAYRYDDKLNEHFTKLNSFNTYSTGDPVKVNKFNSVVILLVHFIRLIYTGLFLL